MDKVRIPLRFGLLAALLVVVPLGAATPTLKP